MACSCLPRLTSRHPSFSATVCPQGDNAVGRDEDWAGDRLPGLLGKIAEPLPLRPWLAPPQRHRRSKWSRAWAPAPAAICAGRVSCGGALSTVFNANYGNNGDGDGVAPLLLIGNRTNNVSIILRELVRQVQEPETLALAGYVVAGGACNIVPNPLVRARGDGGELVTAYSDVNGQFRFAGTLPGTSNITVDAAGFARQVLQDVELGADPVELNLHLEPEAVVTGIIGLADGALNTGQISVGAQLDSLASLTEGSFSTSTVGGEFVLGGLPAGNYEVRIALAGYVEQSFEVTIGAGEAVDLGTVELQPEAMISGSVTSTIGEFPADAAGEYR